MDHSGTNLKISERQDMSATFSKPLIAAAFTVSFAFIGAQVPASAAPATTPPCTGNFLSDFLRQCTNQGHGVDVLTGNCKDVRPEVCSEGAPVNGPKTTSTGGGTGSGTGGTPVNHPLIGACLKDCASGTLVNACGTGCDDPATER